MKDHRRAGRKVQLPTHGRLGTNRLTLVRSCTSSTPPHKEPIKIKNVTRSSSQNQIYDSVTTHIVSHKTQINTNQFATYYQYYKQYSTMVRPSAPAATTAPNRGRRARSRMVSLPVGDAFFDKDRSSRSVTSTVSSESQSTQSSRTSRGGRRVRSVTLLPGSLAHYEFFQQSNVVLPEGSEARLSLNKRNYVRHS